MKSFGFEGPWDQEQELRVWGSLWAYCNYGGAYGKKALMGFIRVVAGAGSLQALVWSHTPPKRPCLGLHPIV